MFRPAMRPTVYALSAAIPLVLASRVMDAQVVIMRSEGGGLVQSNTSSIVHRIVPISDDTVRSLITRYEPGVLDEVTGAIVVNVVLDHDGTYLHSTVRHAQVIQPDSARVISLDGDSVRAFVLPRRADGSGVQVINGGAIAISSLRRAGPGDPSGFLGTGVDPDQVQAISVKRYAPGELGKSQIMVTVVHLK